MRTRRTCAIALVAAATVLAACGGEDKPQSESEQVRDLVEQLRRRLLAGGDYGEACELLHSRRREQLEFGRGQSCEDILEAAAETDARVVKALEGARITSCHDQRGLRARGSGRRVDRRAPGDARARRRRGWRVSESPAGAVTEAAAPRRPPGASARRQCLPRRAVGPHQPGHDALVHARTAAPRAPARSRSRTAPPRHPSAVRSSSTSGEGHDRRESSELREERVGVWKRRWVTCRRVRRGPFLVAVCIAFPSDRFPVRVERVPRAGPIVNGVIRPCAESTTHSRSRCAGAFGRLVAACRRIADSPRFQGADHRRDRRERDGARASRPTRPWTTRSAGCCNALNAVFLGSVHRGGRDPRCSPTGGGPQDFFRNGWNMFDFVVIGSRLPAVRARERDAAADGAAAADRAPAVRDPGAADRRARHRAQPGPDRRHGGTHVLRPLPVRDGRVAAVRRARPGAVRQHRALAADALPGAHPRGLERRARQRRWSTARGRGSTSSASC